VDVLLTVCAKCHEIIQRIVEAQLLLELPDRLVHRLSEAYVPRGTAIEVAGEGVFGI